MKNDTPKRSKGNREHKASPALYATPAAAAAVAAALLVGRSGLKVHSWCSRSSSRAACSAARCDRSMSLQEQPEILATVSGAESSVVD